MMMLDKKFLSQAQFMAKLTKLSSNNKRKSQISIFQKQIGEVIGQKNLEMARIELATDRMRSDLDFIVSEKVGGMGKF